MSKIEELEKIIEEQSRTFGQVSYELNLNINRLKLEISSYREQLALIALGHEYSCGSNEGLRCTCRAGIAVAILKKTETSK